MGSEKGTRVRLVGVMVNGIPFNDPEDHQVYWVDLPDFAGSLEDIQVQRGITDQADRTWVIWDLICFAWLMRPDWVPSRLTPSPLLDDDLLWAHPPGRHTIREAVGIDRDEVFRDFYRKLEMAS